jgi:hypothetical protein
MMPGVAVRRLGAALLTLPLLLAFPASAEKDTGRTAPHPVTVAREGLQDILAYIDADPDLFPTEKTGEERLLTREQRLDVWHAWQAFLDHVIVLDSVGNELSQRYRRAKGEEKKVAFLPAYAAFLAQYRFALDFIHRIEKDRSLHVVLNEPVPELGLKKDAYSKIKFRFLNVLRGAEFARLHRIYRHYGPYPSSELREGVDRDASVLWEAGKGRGTRLTARNAVKVVKDLGFTAWFPVQKKVSRWMGDTKVWRKHRYLITQRQVRAFQPMLQPGDILLERREWYLSNIGLPGYWPHAALYVGPDGERRRFFDDPEVRRWVRQQGREDGDFEAMLRERHPGAYRESRANPEKDNRARVIEAISEGVVFTSLEYSAGADAVVVLRPRLPRTTLARAILRAFHYHGRPYDFNFDFRTDAALVCTELVYKAFEPDPVLGGLHLPLTNVMGRPVTPANEIARWFDETHGTDGQELDFVLFLDGYEKEKRAVYAGEARFRESWRRPKHHILTQED